MNRAHKETWLLIFASFFGALIGKSTDILTSDFKNKWTWIMFFIVMGILYLLVYFSLKLYYKVSKNK